MQASNNAGKINRITANCCNEDFDGNPFNLLGMFPDYVDMGIMNNPVIPITAQPCK